MNFDNLTIGVIGAGAVGGYYGGLLAKAGFNVHFLVKSGSDIINSTGLYIQSTRGDFEVKNVRAHTDPHQMPLCDIILIALKSTSNSQVVELITPLLAPHTLVVNLQNGLGFEEKLEEAIANLNPIAGLCFICSTKLEPGKIRQTDYGQIRLGGDEQYADSLQLLQQVFESADIQCGIDNNRRLARWKKLVWNIPYNGICTVIRRDTSAIIASKALESWASELMKEVQKAAHSEGYSLESEFLEKMTLSTRNMKPYKPSMLVDLENKRPLELEYMYWNPIQAAENSGVQMPLTKALFQQLCWLDPGKFDPF